MITYDRITIDKIKFILKQNKREIKKKFAVKEIGIFGSYLHKKQMDKSDVDILVEFEKVPGFFKFIELEDYLTDLLRIKVDLVMKSALKPGLGKAILSEVSYL